MVIIKKVLKHCKKKDEEANSYVLHLEEYNDIFEYIEFLGPRLFHSPYKYFYWDDYTNKWEVLRTIGMEI